jgi:DNA (cytosine-5)-methyltransferase 1
VPLHGDFTTIRKDQYEPIDLLVGGTPCQSFSIAGLRGGLADDRGNLALEYLKLAQRTRPRWLVWENVPGVLSSAGGRDFGAILGGLVELGYGFAYRVLDAQYVRVDGFGRAVPQRRRRVFVVGHLGDWRRAAAVLFERESLSGNTAPRREAGKGIALTISARPTGGGGLGTDFDLDGGCIPEVCGTLSDGAHMGGGLNGQDAYTGRIIPVSHSLRADGFDASEDGTGRGTPIVPVAYSIMPMNSGKDYKARPVDVAQPVMAGGPVGGNQGGDYVAQPVAFDMAQITSKANRTRVEAGLPASTLNAAGQMHVAHPVAIQERATCENLNAGPSGFGIRTDGAAYTLEARTIPQTVQYGWRVRRLTPTECERLQGFPDGYTDIPWRNKEHSPDGPRYKALG